MGTVEQNKTVWDGDWLDDGSSWSTAWGGVEPQWFGAIFPRIHAFIPTDTMLEVAPGYGRWTQFLKNYCDHLMIVDVAEKCIAACRRRFRAHSHITYHVNDGKSLAMIPDQSVSFVFSFDSLVHADAEIIEAYLTQLAGILKPDGVGWIHPFQPRRVCIQPQERALASGKYDGETLRAILRPGRFAVHCTGDY